jgi:PAS domain S-box-containing protein
MDSHEATKTTGSPADAGRGAAAAAPSGVLTALTQAPIGIAIFDRSMRYLAASRQFLTDQGLPGDTPLAGRLHYDVFPDIPQRWREMHARVLAEGVELSHDGEPFERGSGSPEWIRWSVAPWRTEAGDIGGLVLYTEVVTAAVEARLKLQAAEARYRAIFDYTPVGVARVSPDGRFLEVNERICAITRYSREQLMRRTFIDITHPDDLEADLGLVRSVLRGERDTYTIEKRYLTPGGDVVWVHLMVALVRTSEGAPDYFISTVEEITDRKEAEASQRRYQGQLRLLINELNHRVKNTLATVQSMAAQTLRGDYDPAAAYEAFEARLMGLSAAHEVLTRERWHGASLSEVARRALRPFCGDDSTQVTFEGAEVWLPPGGALALAMVFHELATNAVKYGALSVGEGRVALSWTYDASSGALDLTWVEMGGPPVRPPGRKGFGSRLIERGFRGELRGAATMRYPPTGVVCEMRANVESPDRIVGLFGDL